MSKFAVCVKQNIVFLINVMFILQGINVNCAMCVIALMTIIVINDSIQTKPNKRDLLKFANKMRITSLRNKWLLLSWWNLTFWRNEPILFCCCFFYFKQPNDALWYLDSAERVWFFFIVILICFSFDKLTYTSNEFLSQCKWVIHVTLYIYK